METSRSDGGESGKVGRVGRVGRWVLLGCAVGLALVALLAWALSGFRLSVGPIRVSATDPSRILLQAAALWLLAALVPRATPSGAAVALLPIVAVLVASVIDSSPRRVGDAGEYMAMVLNVSRGGAPALRPIDVRAVTAEMSTMPGFGELDLEQPLVGGDGRQDFYHFWLYPLLVAPFAAVARVAGVHVNHAFTVVNLLLCAPLLYWLVQNGRDHAAALIGAGPLLWWTDKAHTEVFMFVALAFAALLIDRAPALALMAAAVAAAQNPAALVVLGLCAASLALPGARVSVATILAATVIVALDPVYYLWHLGTWSPLSSTIQGVVPGLRALVTPLLDPNLGLLVYAPILCAIACVGIAGQSSRRLLLTLGGGMALLVVFAQSPNMNHGGSPGISRYALWLLALAVPLIADGGARFAARHRVAMYAACAVSVVFSIAVFRPAWPERGGSSPSWLASAMWTRVPALDNPVPEVFAERTSGRDGAPHVPVATALCEKVLIRGDGQDAWWPVPCTPRPAPAECVAEGALCYVNDGVYGLAPRQAGFVFDPVPEHSWTLENTERFDWMLRRLGERLRISRLTDPRGRFAGGSEIEDLYLVEGSVGGAAWVRVVRKPVKPPVLSLDLARASQIELFDDTHAPVRAPLMLPAGTHTIDLPAAPPVLVVVTDQR